MNIMTGRFDRPDIHHRGWFKVYRGRNYPVIEFWFGHRWITIDLGRSR